MCVCLIQEENLVHKSKQTKRAQLESMKKSSSGTSRSGEAAGATTSDKSSTRKKFGLISSLHNSTIKSGSSSSLSSNKSNDGGGGSASKSRTPKTEIDLVDNYARGIPITPSDILKLNTYTRSKFNWLIRND